MARAKNPPAKVVSNDEKMRKGPPTKTVGKADPPVTKAPLGGSTTGSSGNKAKANSPPQAGQGIQRRRVRPGTVALREVRKYQRSTELLFRKGVFHRMVRDVVQEVNSVGPLSPTLNSQYQRVTSL